MKAQEKIIGHVSPITTVDSFTDGRFTTGGYDGRVILWQPGAVIQWHYQAPDLINQVVFDHIGSRLAAACADGNIYVFELKGGTILTTLGPLGDDVNAVAWHPEGNMLATVADALDIDVHIWDLLTGKREISLAGHRHGIFAVCFDPSGSKLATAAEDGTARIWSLKEKKVLRVLEHPGDPETVDWSPDGRLVATGCDDGVLRLWNPETGELIASSNESGSKVGLVKFAKNLPELLAGAYDACVRMHNVKDLTVIRKLEAPFQWERSATFMPNGGVVVGSFGSKPLIYGSLGSSPSDAGKTFGINTIACCPVQSTKGRYVLVGRDDGGVVDIEANIVLYSHRSIVNTAAFSPNGRLLASGDYCGEIKVWDLSRNHIHAATRLSSGPINSLVWSPDGNILASAGYDGVIRWWTPALELIGQRHEHHGPIKSISWNVVTGVLIAGSSDDSVSGWRGQEMLYRRKLKDLVLVNSVDASPVQGRFVSASRDKVVRIWDALSGEIIEVLPKLHHKSIKAIAFAPDGNHILSGSYDGTAILWTRTSSGWTWIKLQLHGKPGVPAVIFDEDTLLTAGWDGTVGRWNFDGKLIKHYQLANTRLES